MHVRTRLLPGEEVEAVPILGEDRRAHAAILPGSRLSRANPSKSERAEVFDFAGTSRAVGLTAAQSPQTRVPKPAGVLPRCPWLCQVHALVSCRQRSPTATPQSRRRSWVETSIGRPWFLASSSRWWLLRFRPTACSSPASRMSPRPAGKSIQRIPVRSPSSPVFHGPRFEWPCLYPSPSRPAHVLPSRPSKKCPSAHVERRVASRVIRLLPDVGTHLRFQRDHPRAPAMCRLTVFSGEHPTKAQSCRWLPRWSERVDDESPIPRCS